MEVSEWVGAVEAGCKRYFAGKPVRKQIMRGTRGKIRIEIGPDVFADLFFARRLDALTML